MKWINVKDRKPLDDQTIFGWQKGREKGELPIFCWYNTEKDCFYPIFSDQTFELNITHWLPLPEPPAENDTTKSK